MLRSSKHTFILSNVLHVPHITKPLLSIQKFCHDNNVYFEFHASVFYVKDLTTKAVLLSGHSNDGLYVLSESSATTIPQAYWSPCISTTYDLWHRRLGHPTSCIFNLLVFKNKIMCNNTYFWLKGGVIINLLVSPQIFLLQLSNFNSTLNDTILANPYRLGFFLFGTWHVLIWSLFFWFHLILPIIYLLTF